MGNFPTNASEKWEINTHLPSEIGCFVYLIRRDRCLGNHYPALCRARLRAHLPTPPLEIAQLDRQARLSSVPIFEETDLE